MTPLQHYFPYFFNTAIFEQSLKSLGYNFRIVYDPDTNLPHELIISNTSLFDGLVSSAPIITIPFGTTLMIHNGCLVSWKTDEDYLQVTKTPLGDNQNTSLQVELDLTKYNWGVNKMVAPKGIDNVVTFVRSSKIVYNLPYYERFLIAIIDSGDIELIPFDSFNKKGGDYGYIWPAICLLDINTRILTGKGMRMADFTIDLKPYH